MNTIERMDELICERSLTLLQLSVMARIPYDTLKSAKKRRTQLSVDTIEAICVGLGITMAEFFSEAEE